MEEISVELKFKDGRKEKRNLAKKSISELRLAFFDDKTMSTKIFEKRSSLTDEKQVYEEIGNVGNVG